MPKRYGKHAKQLSRTLAKLTPNDRLEFDKFRQFLIDKETKTKEEFFEKYGDYITGKDLERTGNA